MAHKHGDEYKDYEVKRIEIRRADDGSYIYTVHAEMMKKDDDDNMMNSYKSFEYTFDSIDDIADAIEDDLTSPHPKKPKKSLLEKELSRNSKHKTTRKY